MSKNTEKHARFVVNWEMRRMLAAVVAESGQDAEMYFRTLGGDAARIVTPCKFKSVMDGRVANIDSGTQALFNAIAASGNYQETPGLDVNDSMRRHLASAMVDLKLNTYGLGRLCEAAGIPDAHPLINKILAGGRLWLPEQDWNTINTVLCDVKLGQDRPRLPAETLGL